MKYVTQDSTLGDDVDITVAPEKALADKEKQNLEKMKVLFESITRTVKPERAHFLPKAQSYICIVKSK